MKRVRLKDVAEEAGCSVQTVSLALRDHESISAERRQQIQEIAAKLGYVKDPRIQALCDYRHGQTKGQSHAGTLLFLRLSVPHGVRPDSFEDRLYAAAKEAAASHGYTLQGWSPAEGGAETLAKVVHHQNIAGLLVHGGEAKEWLRELPMEKLAAISVMSRQEDLRMHEVVTRLYEPTLRATEKALSLCAREHKNAMFVSQSFPHLRESTRRQVFGALTEVASKHLQTPLLSWLDEDPDPCHAVEKMMLAECHLMVGFGLDYPREQKQSAWEVMRSYAEECDYALDFLDLNANPATEVRGLVIRSELIARRAVDLLVGEVAMRRFGWPEHPMSVAVEPEWRS